jgi:hypothetical protein
MNTIGGSWRQRSTSTALTTYRQLTWNINGLSFLQRKYSNENNMLEFLHVCKIEKYLYNRRAKVVMSVSLLHFLCRFKESSVSIQVYSGHSSSIPQSTQREPRDHQDCKARTYATRCLWAYSTERYVVVELCYATPVLRQPTHNYASVTPPDITMS